jgi:hypothetical protein
MEIRSLKITKKDLDKIPENERFFFLQLLNLMNDINVIQKFTLYSIPEGEIEETNKIVQLGQNTVMFCLIFNLVGKLYDGMELIRNLFYGSSVSLEFKNLLSDEESQNLKDLTKTLEQDPLFKSIRNNISSHYGGKDDSDILKKYYQNFSDDEELFIYSGINFGNSISTTQLITINGILEHLKSVPEEDDTEKSLGSLLSKVSKTTLKFQNFIEHCMDKFVGRYFEGMIEIDHIPNVQTVDKVSCPFFVKPRDTTTSNPLNETV